MNSPRHSFLTKTALVLVVFFFIFQLLSPSFLVKNEANAVTIVIGDTEIGEGIITGTIQAIDAKNTVKETTTEVKTTVMDRIFKGMVLSASIALRNATVYLSQKLAEQTVNWLATGEWGQGAMFYEQAWGKFKDDVMNATVGTFLDNLRSEVWAETGFDICDPNPNVKISIMIGLELPNLEDPGMIIQPVDCTLSKFIDNWDAFGDNVYAKYKAFEKEPGAMSLAYLQESGEVAFDVKYAELGSFLKLDDDLKQKQAADAAAEEKQRAEGDGQKAKTSLTGDTIQTPAYAGKARTEQEIEAAKKMPQSEMDASKEVITEIPESMVAAFLNSFVSKAFSELILKKLFEKGVTSNPTAYKPKQYIFENQQQIEKEVAQAVQIQKVSYSASTKEIDLLTQFTSCPQDRQIFNCVIDGDFAQAVRAAEQEKPMSLREAIESGKINGNLPLISSADGRDTASTGDCYEQGWCYSNLVKLRKARIVPIGWEIAANKVNEGETVTLKDAMDKFAVPLTGNAQNDRFYHLIDPEWILRAPKARCEAEVPGPILIGSGSDKRASSCADMKSCLKQDETGKCLAWGYCAAESNVFRFGGADCSGQYDSCRLLTKVDGGKESSLLLNTVDKTGCDPNSAGCKQYSTKRDPITANWSIGTTQALAQAESLFLNKKINDYECNPADEGCTRFVRTGVGLGTSLLGNGGFEVFTGDITFAYDKNNTATSWSNSTDPTQTAVELTTDVFGGLAAVSLNANENVYYNGLSLVPKGYTRYYAISAKAKKAVITANIALSLEAIDSSIGVTSLATGKKDLSAVDVNNWETVYQVIQVQPTIGAAGDVAGGEVSLKFLASSDNVVVDNVVFEEIDQPSATALHEYSDYATKNALYLKQAPSYFSCYDTTPVTAYGRPETDSQINKTNDAAATDKVKGCAGFAKLCSADEVGCEAYKDTDGNATVNGMTSFADYCPQECNGYSTFREDASSLDKGFFPVYFIPKTAKQCTAAAVGCEEFTNLESLNEGKESKEYFSEVRLCAPLPEKVSQCKNFYTWEAKESSGYQLQAYYLLDSDLDGVPDTSDAPDNLVCNKEIFEAQINPNCRAFYNDGGSVYYREYSKTITCSADCHPYRRTLKYVTYEGKSPKVRCLEKKGDWRESAAGDVNNGECIFMTIPSESKVCSAAVAGCKAYKGNQAGNEEILFNAQFTAGDLQTKFEPSPVTVAHVVTLPVGQVAEMNRLSIKQGQLSLDAGEYVLSFWAKKKNAADPVNLGVLVEVMGGATKISAPILPSELGNWRLYTYSFTLSSAEAYAPMTFDLISGAGNGGDAQAKQIDNLQIKRVSDVQYVIKDSWKTPASCDKDLFDEDLDQAQVGCKEYTDRASNIHYLKSFSGLCSSSKVGCEALIDTKNSVSAFGKESLETVPDEVVCSVYPGIAPSGGTYTGVKRISGSAPSKKCEYDYLDIIGQAQTLQLDLNVLCLGFLYDPTTSFGPGQGYIWENNVCKVKTSTTTADSMIYLVNEAKMSCKNTEKGCMALGLPTYKIDPANPTQQIIDAWEPNFYKIDPDLFGSLNSPLCQSYALSCEEYKDEADITYFFKNPEAKLCEWRKGAVGTEYKEAWFAKGVTPDTECSGTVNYYNDGTEHLKKSTDAGYAGWVGLCPGEQDKCTAFVDPTDDPQLDGVGRAYYYLNNEQINKTCTSVDRKTGCLMFNDTTPGLQLTANAEASYDANIQTPATGTAANDSNTVIKVVRDRECGAWYDCKSTSWEWDPSLNKYQEVCDKLGVCTSLTTASDAPKCGSFENEHVDENLLTDNVKLSEGYDTRHTEWSDYDYSGYAIPSLAPINFYDAFDIGGSTADYRLANYDASPSAGCTPATMATDCAAFCGGNTSNEYCRCSGNACVRGNADPTQQIALNLAPPPACRAYPKEDTPFPTVVTGTQAFNNAKIMTAEYTDKIGSVYNIGAKAGKTMKKTEDYGCFYSEFTYGGGAITKYYPLDFYGDVSSLSDGYCQEDPAILCECETEPAGTMKGNNIVLKTKTSCSSLDCGVKEDAKSTGSCMIKSDKDNKVNKFYGWEGYCLERDKSITINNTTGQNPCLTWYPTENLAGLQNTKNMYEGAGYNPPDGMGNLITTEAKGWNVDWFQPLAVANSNTNIPYVKTVASLVSATNGDDDPAVRNLVATFDVDVDSSQATNYLETFVPFTSTETIYKHDILGALIMCDGEHSEDTDWCGKNNFGAEWYNTSRQYMTTVGIDPAKANVGDGFFIPNKDDWGYYENEVGPMSNIKDADVAAQNNYATSKGSLSQYKFYKSDGTEAVLKTDISSTYSGPWTDWTYMQVVWSSAATNTSMPISGSGSMPGGRGDPNSVNRYVFGGGDLVLPFNPAEPDSNYFNQMKSRYEPEKDYEDLTYVAPMFMATGINYDDESCYNTLTKQTLPDEICTGESIDPNGTVVTILGESDSAHLVGNCDTSWGNGDPGEGNYFGVRLMFDSNDKFRGFWVNECDDTGGSGGQAFEIRFIMNEFANRLLKVNDVSITNENKAFTNEIYKRAIATATDQKRINQTGTDADSWVSANTALKPIGSAAGNGKPENLMKIPGKYLNSVIGGNELLDGAITNNTYGGKPWGCLGDTAVCTSTHTKETAFAAVKQFFAQTFDGWIWDSSKNKGVGAYKDDIDSGSYTPTKDFSNVPTAQQGISNGPPIISAVVPLGKTDSEGNKINGAIPGKFTLNGVSGGNLESSSNNYEVVMKFYAWASDNQMPLRKIKVDWGNNDTEIIKEGKFKNHKPRCERISGTATVENLGLCTSSAYVTGVIPAPGSVYGYACKENWECAGISTTATCGGTKESRFGDVYNKAVPGLGDVTACDESYFSYSTNYECSDANVGNAAGKFDDCGGDVHKSPCKTQIGGQWVCRFQPKVQLMDNWDWCNRDSVWTGTGMTTLISMDRGIYLCKNPDDYEYYDGYIYVKPQ
ncbi:MAG: hypothetical protein UT32_C0008G0034 [Parcubacteria group bacterium GW2011_GWC2_39_14]|nr:MAG: hypothetical protein UT32_C0008G0034 [Parcubacteria group bacterium GW2011_GWC2_39_14]KKR54901.1 MAG: hypothetical protein UT91_C0007G0002 [Parcubacteria group bacterium GW2011_GWA2_40_23]